MARDTTPQPLVAIPACIKKINEFFEFHSVGNTYVRAVADCSRARPLIVPAIGTMIAPEDFVSRIDGLVLTGSPSNVEPHHYGDDLDDPEMLRDDRRDATTLPLIRAALEAGLPIFAICRGLQELNVVMGGTLHRKVEEIPGRMNHRGDKGLPFTAKWQPRHRISLVEGGSLHQYAGTRTVMINSLHQQAVRDLADGLEVEATAPDGTIEAVRVKNAPTFQLGVQWHPERWFRADPLSRRMFQEFGQAVRAHAAARDRGFAIAAE